MLDLLTRICLLLLRGSYCYDVDWDIKTRVGVGIKCQRLHKCVELLCFDVTMIGCVSRVLLKHAHLWTSYDKLIFISKSTRVLGDHVDIWRFLEIRLNKMSICRWRPMGVGLIKCNTIPRRNIWRMPITWKCEFALLSWFTRICFPLFLFRIPKVQNISHKPVCVLFLRSHELRHDYKINNAFCQWLARRPKRRRRNLVGHEKLKKHCSFHLTPPTRVCREASVTTTT